MNAIEDLVMDIIIKIFRGMMITTNILRNGYHCSIIYL
jgi:hypothetical protein